MTTKFDCDNFFITENNFLTMQEKIWIGSDADLAIVDLELAKTVSHTMLNSESDFSIYENWSLKGWPICTIVSGNIVMKDGKIVGDKGFGKFIKRKPL